MCDCPLGTLYSNAAVPAESRKVILLGRSILEAHRNNFIYSAVHRVRGRSLCLASPLVRDGEGQAGFGQREASPGDAAGRGQPGVRHPRQHRHEVCGRERGMRERRPVLLRRRHAWAPYSPVRLSSEPTSSELR